MISGRNEATSEAGVGWLKYAVASRLGWIFREQPTQDKGVDAQIEEVFEGSATGRLLGIQIKSGSSWFKKKTRSGYVYTGDLEHLTYWQGHSLPILIVLFDPESSEACWQLVSDEFVKLTPRGWKIVVPFSQTIDKNTVADWHRICLPETAKRFLYRKRRFDQIAQTFTACPERRQTLVYEALSLSRHSVCISTPYISADILAVLDYVSLRCLVRVLIGPTQPDAIWDLLGTRLSERFQVRVCTDLHLKGSVFDSLFLIKGSANLTSIGVTRPNESFSVMVDESRTELVLEEFFELWNGQEPLTLPFRDLL